MSVLEVTKVFRKDKHMATERYRLPELNTGKPVLQPSIVPADTQSRRLLIALALLLVVLAVVVAKNSEFWFGSAEVADTDSGSSQGVSNPSATVSSKNAAVPVMHAAVATSQHPAKVSTVSRDSKAVQPVATESQEPIVATNRVILPPLDVEVVAGDKRSTVHPGSNAMVAQITDDSNHAAITAPAASFMTNASQRERVAAVSAPELRQTIDTTYPFLGQHSRVQGSVVLEAVIATDGTVEGLRVLSGPSILSGAAQQAVREWRFKPVLQNGQPVETKCMVTVNFSIRVSDSSSKVS